MIITGWGAQHALARGARVSTLAACASQLELSPSGVLDRQGDAIAVATSRHLPVGCTPRDRLAWLLGSALREALASRRVRAPIDVVLVGPKGARSALAGIGDPFGVALRQVDVIEGEATAFVQALASARDRLYEGTRDVAVGAVWSPLWPGELAALERAGELHTDGRPGGRVPAEAAAVLRLALGRARPGAPALAGFDRSRDDALGVGALGRVIRRVMGGIEAPAAARVLVDVQPDVSHASRWSEDAHAIADFTLDREIEVWSDQAGYVGTATMAWLSVVALATAEMGLLDGPCALVGHRADDGEVAAVALHLPVARGRFLASVETPRVRELRRPHRGVTEVSRVADARLARSLLEDLGGLGLLLAPGEAGPDRAQTSRRLLVTLDALAALADPGDGVPIAVDVARAIQSYGAEVDPPDRARRFATRFASAHLVARRP